MRATRRVPGEGDSAAAAAACVPGLHEQAVLPVVQKVPGRPTALESTSGNPVAIASFTTIPRSRVVRGG